MGDLAPISTRTARCNMIRSWREELMIDTILRMHRSSTFNESFAAVQITEPRLE